MTGHSQEAAGTAIGGTLGFIKSLTLISAITWNAAFETAVLALIGATVGFLTTLFWKWLKKKLA